MLYEKRIKGELTVSVHSFVGLRKLLDRKITPFPDQHAPKSLINDSLRQFSILGPHCVLQVSFIALHSKDQAFRQDNNVYKQGRKGSDINTFKKKTSLLLKGE